MTKIQQILAMLAEGYSGVEVAERFGVKPHTVYGYKYRSLHQDKCRAWARDASRRYHSKQPRAYTRADADDAIKIVASGYRRPGLRVEELRG